MQVLIANRLSTDRLNRERRKKEADQSSVRLFLIRLKCCAAERGFNLSNPHSHRSCCFLN